LPSATSVAAMLSRSWLIVPTLLMSSPSCPTLRKARARPASRPPALAAGVHTVYVSASIPQCLGHMPPLASLD
jgi:hypothetical protein